MVNPDAMAGNFRHYALALCCALLIPGFSLAARNRQGQRPAAGGSPAQELKRIPIRPGMADDGPAGFTVLVPLDDRPAVAQFARMIGAIADHRVVMPPPDMLGRFTTPGDCEKIDGWLRAQDYSRVDALIVSVDMLIYGGLVASRTHATPLEKAKKRLEFFRWFRQKYPRIPVYAFNVLMRVAPTASAATRGWRDQLARWAELKDRVPKTSDAAARAKLAAELGTLEKSLDPAIIRHYTGARARDLQINLAMLDLVKSGTVSELLLLQDDARVYGLHREDQEQLGARLRQLKLESRVQVYNGADEGSLSLVSRAVIEKFRPAGARVKTAVIYSSENSRKVIAPYEDHPLEFTVENQIRAAGGEIVSDHTAADYLLYINAPGTSDSEFEAFLRVMIADLKAGAPVALADLAFPPPHHSGADERIIRALVRENLVDRFTAYAAWNTAGNTLGTTIPAANMRVFFRRFLNDTPWRGARAAAAHYEFLLHRFAGDYLYHDIVRPRLNSELRKNPDTPTDEFPRELHERVSGQTDAELRPLLEKFYADHFRGRVYPLASYNGKPADVRLGDLRELRIFLPWPRTFESTIEYRIAYEQQ
ncbi:MAG: DUF4127 family protein [Blastocatellia bacterium]